MRKLIRGLFASSNSEITIDQIKKLLKKMKPMLNENITGESSLYSLLEYLTTFKEQSVPLCYTQLIHEITKSTPIVGFIQSQSRDFIASLKCYLDRIVDIFEERDLLDHVYAEGPVLVDFMTKIKEYECHPFLPKQVSEVFNVILDIHTTVGKLAAEWYTIPKFYDEKSEPPMEVFPSLPLHSAKKNFEADKQVHRDDDEECNKEYPKAPRITPGLAHVFCRHGICKGFTAMTTPENPEMFTKFLLRRLPPSVQSKRRVFLYDNACNLHKNALKRDAYGISQFRIFTDRHHWKNHTGCSSSYNCDRYEYLKDVNSQICEQKNRSLRKLSSTLAYCTYDNYMTKVKLFFMMVNFEEKNKF